ncbi:MAG: stage III sporulation AC/AD family protein [Lachnospiraceae bacterium]|nr:stage III sporulation AC/AD family protein [Lachnospiraceae bacterium]
MLKVALIGISGVLLAIQFVQGKKEYGLYIVLACGLIIFMEAMSGISTLVEEILGFEDFMSDGGGYILVLLRIVGITYIVEFTSLICKDAGYQALASQVDMVGKITILVNCVPVLGSLFENLQILMQR